LSEPAESEPTVRGDGAEPGPGATLSRRSALTWAGVLGAGAVLGVGGTSWWRGRDLTNVSLPLYSETVAFRSAGVRELVPPGRVSSVVPGTRVLEAAVGRDALVEAESAWLAASAPWVMQGGEHSALLRAALLDIRALMVDGTSVAGWSEQWRYVWPRDTAHVAVALALAGHRADAESALAWLESVQRDGEWFEARYDPSTHATPDDRSRQLDGLGWALWALDRLDVAHRAAGDTATTERRRVLLDSSLATIVSSLDARTGLPPASPDYWERPESRLTLGTAAPLLVGLRAAERMGARAGLSDATDRARTAADALEAGIVERFGPQGFQRYASGGGHCASLAFLLPPYLEVAVPGADDAFDEARATMARPAGGLAPGAGWRRDGISWTPETAIFANAALATGRRTLGTDLLRWIDAHRTAAGSLPEKVRADGSPASVAPLAWTAAVVVHGVHLARGT